MTTSGSGTESTGYEEKPKSGEKDDSAEISASEPVPASALVQLLHAIGTLAAAKAPTDMTTDDASFKQVQDEGKRAADAAEGAKKEADATGDERDNVRKASSRDQIDEAVKKATEHAKNARTHANTAKSAAGQSSKALKKITEKDKEKIAESVVKRALEDKKNADDDAARAEKVKDEVAKIAATAGAARTTGR